MDRGFINEAWAEMWPQSKLEFLCHDTSDHDAMSCKWGNINFTNREDFVNHVKENLSAQFEGTPLYKLSTKLKHVKRVIKNWAELNGNTPKLARIAHATLQACVDKLKLDPSNTTLQ